MALYLFSDDIKRGMPRYLKYHLENAQDHLWLALEAVGINDEEEYDAEYEIYAATLENCQDTEEDFAEAEIDTKEEAVGMARDFIINACECFDFLVHTIQVTHETPEAITEPERYRIFIQSIFDMQDDLRIGVEILDMLRHEESQHELGLIDNGITPSIKAKKAANIKNLPYKLAKKLLSTRLHEKQFDGVGNSEVARQLAPQIQQFLKRHNRPLTPTNCERRVGEWIAEIRKAQRT